MAPAHSAPLCSWAYQSGTKMKKSPALSTEFGSNLMRVAVSWTTSTSSLKRSTQSGFLIEMKVGGLGGFVGGGGGDVGGCDGGGGGPKGSGGGDVGGSEGGRDGGDEGGRDGGDGEIFTISHGS